MNVKIAKTLARRISAKRIAHRYAFYKGVFASDISNIIRYGRNAPLKYGLFFVDPASIRFIVKYKRKVTAADTGKVMDGGWDKHKERLKKNRKYRLIYRNLSDNGTFTSPDSLVRFYERNPKYQGGRIYDRYNRLEDTFELIKKNGFLSLQSEISDHSIRFREKGGIVVHLGRRGELIFSGHAYHRLAISKFLKLPVIPICIGVVHEKCVASGKFKRFVSRSNELKERYWSMRRSCEYYSSPQHLRQ